MSALRAASLCPRTLVWIKSSHAAQCKSRWVEIAHVRCMHRTALLQFPTLMRRGGMTIWVLDSQDMLSSSLVRSFATQWQAILACQLSNTGS